MKKYLLIGVLSLNLLISCNLGFSGTLGGGNVYRFDCDKNQLNFYLDSIEKNNVSLRIPEDWKMYDDWDETGYSFLQGKIFYINEKNVNVEEMYYVSVIPPLEKTTTAGVSIRSVFRAKEYLLGWKTFEDLPRSEKKEIEERFKNRVLSQLPLKILSVEEK
ncbi:hypothetical protein [Flavobacterium pectinovorum]|jgi:hypothetical protein|uniref:Lipoprotein n=1 Tax=Flavobacterium pectinovorum TaxID=29533 RepID=A0A502E7G0_9FLAO|nr:hypothetical protein [Flavobacterium pectinovorum]TPG33294.1 hypothetical protein EAH81_24525 [Flavobacterium pectinovorum]